MRLIPSDPDVQVLTSRIASGQIDLRPGFQRAFVWNRSKQQRLVDTILRNWHIPPVHMVEMPEGRLDVLDGQQRLRSIFRFRQDEFPINGHIEPNSDEIAQLHGLRYSELPEYWRNRFNGFTIRQFVIVDYKPTEPYELFFRLNQTATLTAPEQRNAFYGPARDTVKSLANYATSKLQWDSSRIGFSNLRMGYDDVITRCLFTLTVETLDEKITSKTLSSWFRENTEFPPKAVRLTRDGMKLLNSAIATSAQVRFNKATLTSWILVACRYIKHGGDADRFPSYLIDLTCLPNEQLDREDAAARHQSNSVILASIYRDRSTSRVADVNSVLLRDVISWIFFPPDRVPSPLQPALRAISKAVDETRPGNLESKVLEVARREGWEQFP